MKEIVFAAVIAGIAFAPVKASAQERGSEGVGNFQPGNKTSAQPAAPPAVVEPAPASLTTNQPAADQPPPAQVPVAEPAPPAAAPAAVVETNVHLLASDDLVEIKVYRQPDLETKARIDRDGTVTMPLVGTINVSGKTPEQARQMIRDLLAKDYLVDPQVNVTIVEYAKRSFIILGEVQRPGTYEIPSGQSFTLLQAIAFAGGYTRIGSPSKVTLQRIEDGQKKVYNLDAGSMAKGENVKPFQVLPNDTITVGERFF
jgi:polysaccharide export outer membrane protein